MPQRVRRAKLPPRSIPPSDTVLSLRIPGTWAKAITALAKAEDRTTASMLRVLLQDALRRRDVLPD